MTGAGFGAHLPGWSAGRGENPWYPMRAAVWAGGVAVPYVQAGAGPPVLFLSGMLGDAAHEPLFFFETARQFRAIAPSIRLGDEEVGVGRELPDAAFSLVLRGFIDGLGLSAVSLVARGPWGIPSLEFALMDPERIRRLALVFQDGEDPVIPAGAATDAFAVSALPVLVLRVGARPDDSGRELAERSGDLLRFLSRPTPASDGGPEP